MRAVVYKKPFEVAVQNVDDPKILHPADAIIRITSSCICGSDLHMYEGRTAAEPGIVFGHENMGVIEEVGSSVKERRVGERVVLCPSTSPVASARIAWAGSRGSARL